MNPAWIDYLDETRARQFATYLEEHEQAVRVRERERAWRRTGPVMPTTPDDDGREPWTGEFGGCTL